MKIVLFAILVFVLFYLVFVFGFFCLCFMFGFCIFVKHFTIVMHTLSWFCVSHIVASMLLLLFLLLLLLLSNEQFENLLQLQFSWLHGAMFTLSTLIIIYIAYNYCCNYNCLEYI